MSRQGNWYPATCFFLCMCCGGTSPGSTERSCDETEQSLPRVICNGITVRVHGRQQHELPRFYLGNSGSRWKWSIASTAFYI